MIPMTIHDFLLTMAACLFVMGVVSIGAGVFILMTKILGDDLKIIAKQTARIAEKGITDDVVGLVGNASTLVDSLNQLVKTTTGIAVFLVGIGVILILSSYVVVTQIS